MLATLINVTDNLTTVEVNINDIEKSTVNKGNGKIQKLHKWHYENFEIIIFGWKDGHHKMVNKHELPTPFENTLLFGDLVVIIKEDDEYDDFPKEDYEEFYDYMFGGFDTCSSGDDESDLENDEYDFNDGFLVKDI